MESDTKRHTRAHTRTDRRCPMIHQSFCHDSSHHSYDRLSPSPLLLFLLLLCRVILKKRMKMMMPHSNNIDSNVSHSYRIHCKADTHAQQHAHINHTRLSEISLVVCILTIPTSFFLSSRPPSLRPRFGAHTRVSKGEFATLVKEVHELCYVVCHLYQNVREERNGGERGNMGRATAMPMHARPRAYV